MDDAADLVVVLDLGDDPARILGWSISLSDAPEGITNADYMGDVLSVHRDCFRRWPEAPGDAHAPDGDDDGSDYCCAEGLHCSYRFHPVVTSLPLGVVIMTGLPGSSIIRLSQSVGIRMARPYLKHGISPRLTAS
jgi:hypothetical protein